MRRVLMIGVLSFGWMSQSAVAQTYDGCSTDQVEIIDDALRAAKALTLKAAVTIGDTPDYSRWFGAYSDANAEKARANLKAIVAAIRGGGVTAQCDVIAQDGCAQGEYAWVRPDEPYHIHLCPSFFQLPPLARLQPGTRRSANGTREGTIVHEVSHFSYVAQTSDHCYSRTECTDMAQTDVQRAITNADSYQYFTEDVTYFARQPIANKPPPAPRK